MDTAKVQHQSVEYQSAQMSKITIDGLTQSGTGCCIAVPYVNSGRQKVKEEEFTAALD